jgi:peptidoglycan/xylan/chitin deacetylase (PgdA/CDA1 family)
VRGDWRIWSPSGPGPSRPGLRKLTRAVHRYLRRGLDTALRRLVTSQPKPLILTYHRIADEPLDPWGLAVSPNNFKEHLDILRRNREPMSLTDFVAHLLNRTLAANAVAITFDDGYVDNLMTAKPLLAAAHVPATVFLAVGFLGQRYDFWWDDLTRFILLGTPRESFEISVRGETIRLDLKDTAAETGKGWRAWIDPPQTIRQKTYLAVWKALRGLDTLERETILSRIRGGFAECPLSASPRRPLTYAEVRALSNDGLIALGAHSVTHPALTELDAIDQRREIAASKETCEVLAGCDVKAFAYPFGDFNADVRAVVRDLGFTCACTTRHGSITFHSDIFTLPRTHVLNLDGDAFDRSLRFAAGV